MMFTKKGERGLPSGDDVEATLARTEVLLEEGDLESATREMNGLKGWAGVLSRDWVAETRRVLEVRQAVDVSVSATSFFSRLFTNSNFTGHRRRGSSAELARQVDAGSNASGAVCLFCRSHVKTDSRLLLSSVPQRETGA
jgi:hypothetical protein